MKKAEVFPSGGSRREKIGVTSSWIVIGVVVIVYGFAMKTTQFDPFVVVREGDMFVQLVREMVPQTKERWMHLLTNYLPRLRTPLLQTVHMAIVGTVSGTLLSVPMIVFGSRHTSPHRVVYFTCKAFMNVLRTVPDLLYAAVFVAAIGVGPLSGVLALTVFSAAFLTKLMTESADSVDPDPIESVRAAGGTRLHVLRYAVVPQIAPVFWSHCLYVFEVNVRASTVLGLVGAGGIGQQLQLMLSLFQYENAFIIIVVTFLLVVVIDLTAGRIRERLV